MSHFSFSCPLLIGRGAELNSISKTLSAVSKLEGQTLLISGEAGIGKSRLIEETKSQAKSQGFRVIQGRCFEPDRILPYALFLDALRPLPPSSPLFTRLINPTQIESEREKYFLQESLISFILSFASPAMPLFLILEDLHWSDEASLETALRLTRQIAGSTYPLLLVLTYRNDEG